MKIRDKVLPVLRPLGGEEEIASLRESIESGWWGKGPKVAEFDTVSYTHLTLPTKA